MEYAKVDAGMVTWVIVADSAHIADRTDGPWILTPYDGTTGKVGVGFTYDGAAFTPPPPPPLPAPQPLPPGAPTTPPQAHP